MLFFLPREHVYRYRPNSRKVIHEGYDVLLWAVRIWRMTEWPKPDRMEVNIEYSALDAPSARLALHGIFHQLTRPLLKLLLMHYALFIKEFGVRYRPASFTSCQKRFAPRRRAVVCQGQGISRLDWFWWRWSWLFSRNGTRVNDQSFSYNLRRER